MNYGDVIEYTDGTFDENFNNAKRWAEGHSTTFEEDMSKRKLPLRYFVIGQEPIHEPLPEPEPVEPTLEELKEQKRLEINQARDEAEQGGFEYLGKMFDSDPISCIRMMGASQSLANASAETKITWTCQDNSTIDLNGSQFVGLVVALATHSNTCHQKATELKVMIEEAKTKEELDKITWYEEESNNSDSVLSEAPENKGQSEDESEEVI